MEGVLKQLDAWHKTRAGYLIMGIVELGIAYMLASRAIDTGSWWQYLFTLIFLIGGLRNLISIFTKGHVQKS